MLTVVSSRGVRITKQWCADGSIAAAPEALNYTWRALPVTDLASLSSALIDLQSDPYSCVIRGAFKPDAEALSAAEGLSGYRTGHVLRRYSTTTDEPRRWAMLDVDGYAYAPGLTPEQACLEYVADCLPPEFQGVSFHWHLSSSFGHARTTPGVLKAHLWYWLDTAYTSAHLRAWVKARGIECDPAVFQRVQPHFTADPVLELGVADPVPARSGLYLGARPSVPLVIDTQAVEDAGESRRAKLDAAAEADPVARTLNERGMVLGTHRDGGLFITCPRESEHSGPSGETSTMYYPANTGGYARGHFKCLHSHCLEATDEDFLAAMGLSSLDTALAERLQAALEMTPETVATVEQYLRDIGAATMETLRNEVIPRIRADESIEFIDRERMAGRIHAAFKAEGAVLPIATVRGLIAPQVAERVESRDMPEWAKPYVYVGTENKFFHTERRVLYGREGFQGMHNRLMGMRFDGQREDAARAALEQWDIETVDGLMYWPAAGAIFEYDHKRYVNRYNAASTPECAPIVEAAEGIKRFELHLWHLCGKRHEVYHGLMTWMAHNVQRPGVKIAYAPIIKGCYGDGKSTILNVLEAVMGGSNVFSLSNDLLSAPHNDYAHGHAVVGVEEMMMTGRDRYTVANKVKPFITNSTIAYHPKGLKAITAINTSNWIAFTNFPDAVPMSEDDRRWWVIFSPFSKIADYERALGIPAGTIVDRHFHIIHDSMQRWPGQWRTHFLAYPIPKSFNRNERAPLTAERQRMAASGREEADEVALQVIEEGAVGVTQEVLSTRCLSAAMATTGGLGFRVPEGPAMSFMLSRLGYEKIGNFLKWDNASHRVWVKPGVDVGNEALRRALEGSKK